MILCWLPYKPARLDTLHKVSQRIVYTVVNRDIPQGSHSQWQVNMKLRVSKVEKR